MKFDYIIGNPPYQEETVGDQTSFAPPVYHRFMEAAYQLADKVELITPARFLFDAGATPGDWNQKMLNDPHLKVLMYEPDSSRLFPDTAINGGVAVTYRDATKNFGAIGTFTPFPELASVLQKVQSQADFVPLSSVMTNRGLYRFSEKAYEEHPDEMKKISDSRILSSSFSRMPDLFPEMQPQDGAEYIQIYGNLNNQQRVCRWFRKEYLKPVPNLAKYKVLVSKANGAAGQISKPIPARITGRPVVIGPGVGCTETYITMGATDTRSEAEATAKYVKTKFARSLVGVLKVTQDLTAEKWRCVPLQDFSSASDIDWTRPVADIDCQLYKKYGLSEDEIGFIESHVETMD